MGKKLNEKDAKKSYRQVFNAIKSVTNNITLRIHTSVTVIDTKNNIIFNDTVLVNISEGRYGTSTPFEIGVIWEDAKLPNYKDYGLYGIYSTDYCKVKYDSSVFTITIFSDNNIRINIKIHS